MTQPSYMSSGSIQTPEVITKKVITDEVSVNGQSITGVSYDGTDTDIKQVATAYSLNQVKAALIRDMTAFQHQLNMVELTPIVSEAITPPYFDNDSKWSKQQFIYQYGQAVYRNTNDNSTNNDQAALYLDTSVFAASGTYFVVVDIPELTGGKLILSDNNGNIIREFITSGNYSLEVPVSDVNGFSFSLHVQNTKPDDRVVVNRLYIYYVQSRGEQYFKYIGEKILAGGGSLASESYVNTKIGELRTEVNAYAESAAKVVDNKLQTHAANKNGHNTTPADIGAALEVHTHTAASIGAAPTVHTHTVASIGAAPASHTHIPSECGAAPTVHTHTPVECGAATAEHNHNVANLVGGQSVVTHINATGNVHSLTKSQIELGKVNNYDVAALIDFESRNTDRYTTPDGVGSYLDKIFTNDPTLKYIPLAPKRLLKQSIVLNDGQEYAFTLKKDSIYDIYISCRATLNAQCLGLYFKNNAYASGETKYLNSYEYGRVVDGVNTPSWLSEATNMFYCLPSIVGNNILKGKMTIDTSMFTVFGSYQTWVGTMQGTTPVFNNLTAYPVVSKGTFKETTDMTADTYQVALRANYSRIIPASTTPVSADIIIYEVVNATQDANIIDRSPLFSRTSYLGTAAPLGWGIENGGVVTRGGIYQELEDNINAKGLGVTAEVYANSVTTTGKCPYFVIGETTVRLPTMLSDTTGCINIIKIRMK